MEINFIYNNTSQPNLLILKNINPKKTSVTKLKRILIERFGELHFSKTAFRWNLEINENLVNDFEAANLKASAFGKRPTVRLSYKGVSLKRKHNDEMSSVIEKIKKNQKEPVVVYNLTKKLLLLIKDQALYGSRQDNGLQIHQVFRFFSMIKANINNILQQPLKIFIQTDISQIFPNGESDVILKPLFVPQHVSLLCYYGSEKVINIDSSGTSLKSPGVSQTFINYQTFDKTMQIQGGHSLAGGNCAIFTILNAIRCILEYRRYKNMQATFDMFWSRLKQVVEKSNADVSSLLVDMVARIFSGTGLQVPTVPVGVLMEIIPNLLSKKNDVDYIADIIMLDLFLDTKIGGFESVSLLGNVARLYLKDLVDARGQFIGGNMREGAGAVRLSALILLREIEPTTDEKETLETYLFVNNVVDKDMEIDEFENKYAVFPLKMADAVLKHFFTDDKTSGQMLARKFLNKKEDIKVVQYIQYHAELPIPEQSFSLGPLLTFDSALLDPGLYQRLIRVPSNIFNQSIEHDGAVVIIHNIRTNVATMARIEGPSEMGKLRISSLVADSLKDLKGPLSLRVYGNVASVDFVRFNHIEGDSSDLREALEARIDWIPGLVTGEILKLPNAKVQVKEILVEKLPVRFATIKTGEIQFEIDPKCNHCANRTVGHVCQNCRQAYYCGKECQTLDWVRHERTCFNFSNLQTTNKQFF